MDPDRVELRNVFRGRDAEIVDIGGKFLQELRTKEMGTRLYVESLAHQLAVYLLRTYCTLQPRIHHYRGGLSPSQRRRVLDYIDEHLNEELSLKKLANHLNLSSDHFLKMFKQSIGSPPHQYVIEHRLKRAKKLLKDTQLSVADIASRVGYKTPSHFTSQFRKLIGTTPKAYRKA
jgi:AraC family transcriptional regulator